MKVLEGLSNAEIINILYGRLLRIISNKGLNNKNTNYTESAVDIGRFLINTLVLNEYNQDAKPSASQSFPPSPTPCCNCYCYFYLKEQEL